MPHSKPLALVCCLLLVGCGGSSSDKAVTPPALDLFTGSFHATVVGVGFDSGAADSVAIWGTASPDGAGALPVTITENADGLITGPTLMSDFGYGLDTSRTLTLFDVATPTVTSHTGGLSADGNKAILGEVEPGENPQLVLFLRKSGTHSDASLTGNYHVGAFFTRDNETSPMPLALTGTAVLDGSGSGTATGMENNSGAPPTAFTDAVTYSVAADGTLTYTQRTAMSGGVLEGGQVATIAGSTTDTLEQRLFVLVKETTGGTNALFSGTYRIVVIEGETGLHGSMTGILVADGAGAISITSSTENDEGVITTGGPDTATYTVGANGSLVVTTGGSSDILEGGMSADGTFGFVSGGTNNGSHPTFVLFVK